MALLELISEDIVKVPLAAGTKTEVIRELIATLKDSGKIEDTEAVYDAIMKRESQGSTGLEKGIAVPHSKCTEVKTLTMAIGISHTGIDFESLDGQPAQLFFLILAPPDQSGPHIQALSEIAKLSKSNVFLRLIKSAQTAGEVVELFTEE